MGAGPHNSIKPTQFYTNLKNNEKYAKNFLKYIIYIDTNVIGYDTVDKILMCD